MDAVSVLLIVLIVAAIAVCAVAVFALRESITTLRSVRRFFDDSEARLIPLLEKADVSVDAINAELLRVDGIVTSLEEVSETVSSATTAVREAAHAPSAALNALGTRLRKMARTAKE